MTKNLQNLLDLAKNADLSEADRERQRRSFAYGNTKFENDRITQEMVNEEAENLKVKNGSED
jgi:hypothetical protein